MEGSLDQLTVLLIALVTGAISSNLVTWFRWLNIGIGEEGMANITGAFAEAASTLLAAVLPPLLMWALSLFGSEFAPTLAQIVLLIFGSMGGSRLQYISSRGAGKQV